MTAYLTVQEVAEIGRMEHKSVRRAIAAGDLTAFRPANRLLIREQDATAWIESKRVTASRPRPYAPRNGRSRGPVEGSVADLREIERRVVAS